MRPVLLVAARRAEPRRLPHHAHHEVVERADLKVDDHERRAVVQRLEPALHAGAGVLERVGLRGRRADGVAVVGRREVVAAVKRARAAAEAVQRLRGAQALLGDQRALRLLLRQGHVRAVVRHARRRARLEHLGAVGQRGERGAERRAAPVERVVLCVEREHLVGLERDEVGGVRRVQLHHPAHHVGAVLRVVSLAPPHVPTHLAEPLQHPLRQRVLAAVVQDDDLVGRERLAVIVDHVGQVLALVALQQEDARHPRGWPGPRHVAHRRASRHRVLGRGPHVLRRLLLQLVLEAPRPA